MEKKYRIIHIAFKHSIDDIRILKKECVSLAKKKYYDVTYITSDINSNANDNWEKGVLKKIIPANDKRIIRQFKYITQIKKFIKNNDSINVVHLHEAPLLLMALWIKKRGIKVIFDSHEDYYKQIQLSNGNVIINKLISKAYKLYEKHVCKKIDAVIFPCKMLDGEVFDYNVKRLVYIDNYPILTENMPSIMKKTDFKACYTGTISYERGVVNDIKAWKKANVKGILAGLFSSTKLKEQIESMEEFNNVDYRGYCNSQEIDEIYKEASVGMATLLNYGQYHKSCNFPTKVCEYMMYGIPTIIYKTPFVEKAIKEYKFGIMVNPDNIDEIVSAILYLKNNKNVAKEMGEAGRKAVEEKYNWNVEEIKLYKLYDDILENI